MSVQRRFLSWGAFFLVFCALFWALGRVMTPFLAGMAVAYFLDPLADRLQRSGLSRLAASALIMVVLLLSFMLALAVMGPPLAAQLAGLIESAPGWFESAREKVMGLLGSGFLERLGLNGGEPAAAVGAAAGEGAGALAPEGVNVTQIIGTGAAGGVQILKVILSGGAAMIGVIANFAIALVVAFYMLLDWDRMVNAIDGWLPRDHAPVIRRLAREIDGTLAGFVRGQLLVCVILGGFYAVSLTLLGLNYGLLIGVFAGMVSFIPFVGSAMGLLLSMGVALAQFWGDWIMIAAVGGVFLFGQLVEGNFLSPKLVGDRVGLHPVLLIFALTAFGSLFGFAGMLVAVPMAAAIGVLARYALEIYFDSRLYKGDAPDAQAQADAAKMVAAVTRDEDKAAAAQIVAEVMAGAAREAKGDDPAGSPPPLPSS